jgi:hypothetical protein
MSDEPPGFFETFTRPGARAYAFTGFAALLVYFVLAAERCGDLGALLTVVIAVPGLLARWVISPALFLILLTYLLYDPNFGGLAEYLQGSAFYPWSYRRSLGVEDVLLILSVVVYLMAQFRLLSFIHKSMPDDPPPRRKGQPEPKTPRRPSRLFGERELAFLLGAACFCVLGGVVAWFLVEGIESGEGLARGWGVGRPLARLMLFLWAVVTGSVIAGVVFRHAALRRMSRLQARLMLQDQFWQETRREQERIYRWRRWFKGRKKAPQEGS